MRNFAFPQACGIYILLLLMVACGRGGDAPVPALSTPAYQGQVQLVDEFGIKLLDQSGVTVSVVDQPTNQATTDAGGSFTLNMPQGTQRLNFAKTGYGTYLTAPLTVTTAPATLPKPIVLGQISSTYLTYFRDWEVIQFGIYYRFMGRISGPSTASQVRFHRLFYATSPDVSPINYKATSLFSGSFPDPGGNPNWHWVSDSVSRATVLSINAGSRDKIYGIVYGDNPAAATYVDPATGQTIYPALSKQASTVFECAR